MTETESQDLRLTAVRARVLERIADAARRAGRDPSAVRIVAVTKGVEVARVRAAVAAGFTTFGENRVQEAGAKIGEVGGGAWHLIGPLQSNKARRAIELFQVIESVDSLELARRLDRIVGEVRPGGALSVLLQVNVDADPAKAGFSPSAVEAALPELLDLPRLRLEGLMTVGRAVERAEEARPTFAALRELGARLRASNPGLGPGCSMGMSDDYPVAVEEGATIVRIGRAIFGERRPVGQG